jgi:protein-disulfide isomerase
MKLAKLKETNIIQYVFVALLLVAAFMLGSLYTKVQYLEAEKKNTQQPTAQQKEQAPTVTIDTIKNVFKKAVVKFGDVNKKVMFVEISDPSCPYCHAAAGLNPELNKQIDAGSGRPQFTLVSDGGPYIAPVQEFEKLVNAGKASMAYVYFPGHGNGEMGMKAMYCAFEKNKFWEVHNKLYTKEGYDLMNTVVKNDKTKSQDLVDFLASAMDPKSLKECLDSGKYDAKLLEDTALAKTMGVSGTPGFYVNTTFFAGAYNYTNMEDVVKKAL